MIKNKLRVILAEMDMKPSELHKLTGIHKTSIYRIYHNTFTGITLEQIDKICTALEITPNDLFEYTPD